MVEPSSPKKSPDTTKQEDQQQIKTSQDKQKTVDEKPELHPACRLKRGKKKSKDEYEAVEPNKCPFMYEHKRKPCRKALWKRPDLTKSAYCVSHAHLDSPDVKFVNCPHEPFNYMPESGLEHHLKVCPAWA